MGETLAGNVIYRNVYAFVEGALGPDWAWAAYAAGGLAIILLVANAVMAVGAGYTWFERRLLGRFQGRLGPNRAGPFGLFQPLADAVKLITKEDVIALGADKVVFTLAPVAMLAPTILVLAVIPFGAGSWLADLNVAVLYIAAVSGISTIAVMMAGYASPNSFSLFGSMRAVAMLVSYEVPLVMALLGVAILAQSMSLVDVVEAQALPFLIVTPLGALVFLAAISAELNRAPFDVTEAESELVAGYMTEYSGMKYGVFMLAEFTNTVVAGAIFAALFLQGWKWAVLPSHVWFLVKVAGFVFVAVWVRATLPRFRLDQILAAAWKYLFPLSLLNAMLLAAEVIVWPERGAAELGVMAAINWAISVPAALLWSKAVSLRSAPPVRFPARRPSPAERERESEEGGAYSPARRLSHAERERGAEESRAYAPSDEDHSRVGAAPNDDRHSRVGGNPVGAERQNPQPPAAPTAPHPINPAYARASSDPLSRLAGEGRGEGAGECQTEAG